MSQRNDAHSQCDHNETEKDVRKHLIDVNNRVRSMRHDTHVGPMSAKPRARCNQLSLRSGLYGEAATLARRRPLCARRARKSIERSCRRSNDKRWPMLRIATSGSSDLSKQKRVVADSSSRADVASSSSRIDGLSNRARAKLIRCCSPGERISLHGAVSSRPSSSVASPTLARMSRSRRSGIVPSLAG